MRETCCLDKNTISFLNFHFLLFCSAMSIFPFQILMTLKKKKPYLYIWSLLEFKISPSENAGNLPGCLRCSFLICFVMSSFVLILKNKRGHGCPALERQHQGGDRSLTKAHSLPETAQRGAARGPGPVGWLLPAESQGVLRACSQSKTALKEEWCYFRVLSSLPFPSVRYPWGEAEQECIFWTDFLSGCRFDGAGSQVGLPSSTLPW